MAPEQRGEPALLFAAVARDGRVKALWSDNALLLLSSGGEAFAAAPPPGTSSGSGASAPHAPPIVRQLSEFAISRFAPRLTAALRFRNLHADAPACCAPLAAAAAAAGDAFSLGYAISHVYWPPSAAAALAGGLVEFLDGGRAAVRSRCGAARLVLDAPPRARFAVCYPLLLPCRRAGGRPGSAGSAGGGGASGSGSGSGSGERTHVWQTQVFSTREFPERWAPGLALALAVADGASAVAAGAGGSGGGDDAGADARAPAPDGGGGALAAAAAVGAAGAAAGAAAAAAAAASLAAGAAAAAASYCGRGLLAGVNSAAAAPVGRGLAPPSPRRGGGGGGGGLTAMEAMTWLPEVIWPDYGSSGSSGGGGGGGHTSTALVPGRPGSSVGASAAVAALAECFPEGSWWFEASPLLPPDLPLSVVWTPEATYILLQVGRLTGRGLFEGEAGGPARRWPERSARSGRRLEPPAASPHPTLASLLLSDSLPIAPHLMPPLITQECGEVEAWLHEDDSVMTTDGPEFVRHPLPGEVRVGHSCARGRGRRRRCRLSADPCAALCGPYAGPHAGAAPVKTPCPTPQVDPRVYAVGAIPDAVVSMATGRRLAVGGVAAHALKLRCAQR
jgi:hypothetical protein